MLTLDCEGIDRFDDAGGLCFVADWNKKGIGECVCSTLWKWPEVARCRLEIHVPGVAATGGDEAQSKRRTDACSVGKRVFSDGGDGAEEFAYNPCVTDEFDALLEILPEVR